MSVISKPITLTANGDRVFSLSSNRLIRVIPRIEGDCDLYYDGFGNNPERVRVTQSASTVFTASGNLIPLTVGGQTEYINPNYIVLLIANGSGTNVSFNGFGTNPQIITASESVSVLTTLINNFITDGLPFGVASGTNTYTVTVSPSISEYTPGKPFIAKIVNSNTSSTVTINANGLGALAVKAYGTTDLGIGDLKANTPYIFEPDGTNIILLGEDKSGVTAFTQLTDVPSSYSGQGLKSVRVNAGATALEFYTPSAGVTTFTGLSDVPNSYSGQGLKQVRVNAGATALEFFTATTGLGTSGENYVIVETGSNEATNGVNLKAAYTTAAGLTPGGNPLSATNRATVLMMPGQYNLDAGTFALNTQFVDLVGLSINREDTVLYSTNGVKILTLSTGNVQLNNFTLDVRGTGVGIDISATSVQSQTHKFDNIKFLVAVGGKDMNSTNGYRGNYSNLDSITVGNSTLLGGAAVDSLAIIKNCTVTSGAVCNAFGGLGSSADGSWKDCTTTSVGDNNSFGAGQSTPGTYTNCKTLSTTGDNNSFSGSTGAAGGTYIDCEALATIGANTSFGGGNDDFAQAYGTFININRNGNWATQFSGKLIGTTFNGNITKVLNGSVLKRNTLRGSINSSTTAQTTKMSYNEFASDPATNNLTQQLTATFAQAFNFVDAAI